MIVCYSENPVCLNLLAETLNRSGLAVEGVQTREALKEKLSETSECLVLDRLTLSEQDLEKEVYSIAYPVVWMDSSSPFRPGALLDKIIASLKSNRPSEIDAFPFLFNTRENVLIKDDKKVKLTDKEKEIFLYLFDNKNEIVSRDALLHHVWAYADTVETHTLETHIYRLRQKMEENPSQPEYLLTEGNGYKLKL